MTHAVNNACFPAWLVVLSLGCVYTVVIIVDVARRVSVSDEMDGRCCGFPSRLIIQAFVGTLLP